MTGRGTGYDYADLHVLPNGNGLQLFERRFGRIVTDAHGRPKRVLANGDFSYEMLMKLKDHPTDKIVTGWVLVPVTIRD